METCSADSFTRCLCRTNSSENGINDNLLFNWRHLWRNGGLQPPCEHETSLLPVTLTPEPDNKIPAPVQIPEQINTLPDSLCCELVLPAGTLRPKVN